MSKSKSKNFFEQLHSGYWLGNLKYQKFDPNDDYSLVKMASFRRAVANFIFIVTGKHVPVKYNVQSEKSYTTTTGKYMGVKYVSVPSVVISADFKNEEVDGIVGVALHEATHIVKSDMDFFMYKITNGHVSDEGLRSRLPKRIFDETKKRFNLTELETIKRFHRLLNWIEDRRIDRWQIERAPGYEPYYKSMYKKYFRNPLISKVLMSDYFRDETYDSYQYRIINFLNKNTDLDALKGLREIWNIIDLRNIDRLKQTKDSFKVALDVWDVIMKNINSIKSNQESQKETGKSNESFGDSWQADGDEVDDETRDDEPQEISDENFNKMLKDIENGKYLNNKNGKTTPIKLSEEQMKKLAEAIEKQEKFLEGNIDKGNPISEELNERLGRIEKFGTTIEKATADKNPRSQTLHGAPDNKIPVIVVRELTEANIGDTPMGNPYAVLMSTSAVERGISMGTQLARKLIIRNENRKTVLTRKRTGRIDKRLLSGLGYGTDSIFQQRYVDQFGEALIHISVDASSSMYSSTKWGNALATCVAIAKAADLVNNLDVIVSFRTSTCSNNGGNIPYILIAYDSRKDPFVKIRKLFTRLTPTNYTPEGLCYEAIMKDILQSMNGKDGLFINFSDGEPCLPNPAFSNVDRYGGEPAHRQTRFQVNRMLNNGIKVLSFFISSSYDDFSGFQSSYGSAAKNIDTQSITAIAAEVNKMFTSKDKKFRKSL